MGSGKKLDYKKWSKFDLKINSLKRRAKKDPVKNERFKRINQSINYLEKEEDTLVSLNEVEAQKEEEAGKKENGAV